jgi:hypothetical protein
MKRRVTRRGVHEQIQWLSDDGKPTELDWAELSEADRREISSIGFAGLGDFLGRASPSDAAARSQIVCRPRAM